MITVGSVVSFEMEQTGDRAQSMLVLSHLILWMCEFVKFLVSFVCFREYRTWRRWCEWKKTVSFGGDGSWGNIARFVCFWGQINLNHEAITGDSNLKLDRR